MKKKLGYFDVFSLVIGSIIGWGSFTLPGKQFLSKSGVINTTLGLFIGGALVIIIQFAYVFHYILLISLQFAYLQKLLLKHLPDSALIR